MDNLGQPMSYHDVCYFKIPAIPEVKPEIAKMRFEMN